MSDTPQRRADDTRIDALAKEVAELRGTVTEVREILASFRVALKIAKGCGVVAAAGTALMGFAISLKSGWTTFHK